MNHIEPLDPRRLLAIDLTAGALSAVKFPTTVEANAIPKSAIVVKLAVTNSGDETLPRTAAKVNVAFLLRKADNTEVPLASKLLPVANLKATKTLNVIVPIKLPQTLAQGDYTLVARVDTGNVLAESNETNNAANGASLSIVPGGTALFARYGFADTITFTRTDFSSGVNGSSTEAGRWVDINGVTGGYNLIVSKLGRAKSTTISIFRDGLGIEKQYAGLTIASATVFNNSITGKTLVFSGKGPGTKVTGSPTAAGSFIFARVR